MTGSLQIKNDTYYAVINLYDGNKKRRQKWISTGLSVKGNKKKAELFLRNTIHQFENENRKVSSDMLFSDYIRAWLKVAAMKVDIVTLQGYEASAVTHIIPYFEANKIRLNDIDHYILQEYFNSKYKNGRIDSKGGLSPKTLRIHKNVISQTLDEAVKNEFISNNPCNKIVLPQLQRFEYKTYSADQIKRLFNTIHDEPLYPLIMVTLVFGLRRSEVLGIKWDSIDFDKRMLTIKHTVSKGTKTVEKDKTKNSTSYRSFPISEEIINMFIREKHNENRNKRLFGKSYVKNDYVFKWDDGRPYAPEFVTHKFAKILKSYNFPHIRFHELRHSCASYLASTGFNMKDIQEWLGHADIKLTANLYSHLDISRKHTIADAMSNIGVEK